MKLINLTRGKVALVDDEDYERVIEKGSWYACEKRGVFYASRVIGPRKDRHPLYMHRLIVNAKPEERFDHKNRNSLDNRRENLRRCSNSQNLQNRPCTVKNSVRYKGVCKARRTHELKRPWKAEIQFDNRRLHLGYFQSADEAAKAYDQAAVKYHGPFAFTNFAMDEGG